MTCQHVVFTAYNRPHYMRTVIQSWSKARGIEDAHLKFCVEPNEAGMEQAIAEETAALPCPVTIHGNDRLLGVQSNPYVALQGVFQEGFPEPRPYDFVILAEDDLVVSDDVLEWFAWARDEFYAKPQALCVTANQFEEQPGGLAQSLYVPWFHCWVWGIWRNRWENLIQPDWTFNYEHKGWDWRINDFWVRERGYKVVAPALSRSQHIGQFGGMHTASWEWHSQMSRCYRPAVPPQEYRFPAAEEPVECPML